MSVKENDNATALTSHTEENEKNPVREKREKRGKKKWFYFNMKSCTAMAVSAALLFTSIDGMPVRAEKLADMVPAVAEEQNPEVSKDVEVTDVSPYLTNKEGAVVISSFKELPEEERIIELKEPVTPEKVREGMPETLTAYVTAAASVSENTPGEEKPDPGESEKPDESEGNPGGSEKPGESEGNPGESGAPVEGEPNPGEGEKPGEGEGNPGESEKPGEGEGNPDEGEKPGESEGNPGGSEKPGESEGNPGENEKPDESGAYPGSGMPGEGGTNPGEGEAQPETGESGVQSGADSGNGDNSGADQGNDGQSTDGQSVADDTNDVATAEGVSLAQDGNQWRLLVETGESEALAGVSDVAESGNEGSGDAEESTGGTENENMGSSGGTENGDGAGGSIEGSGETAGGTGNESADEGADGLEGGSVGDGTVSADAPVAGEEEQPDIVASPVDDTSSTEATEGSTQPVPITSWECEEYDADYASEGGLKANTSYLFVPKWDEAKWFFEESEDNRIPTIEVVYARTSEITSEEGLRAAFEAGGSQKITLQSDIALTKPLVLPADANIELDGGGYTLTRGNADAGEDGNAGTFLGIMINMNGENYGRDKYGRLRLTNITVDGSVPGNRADAPVIVDYGRLTLGMDAQIKGNYNYGTLKDVGTGAERIPEYGGGICVYRELILEDRSQPSKPSVTGNYADLLGGGVYLEEGAELWLYGDVIQNNTVKMLAAWYSSDLYAAPYSKIHYNAAAFPDIKNRSGFYICKGAILLPIGEGEEIPEPAERHNKEIYIATSKESGYSVPELMELKRALQTLGYTVLSSKRTEIDTTDLRNWNVYDHYDTGLWSMGNWYTAYAEYRNRPYYPCTEKNYTDNPSDPPATTIEEWLTEVGNGYYRWSGEIDNSVLSLARFKEHLYSRGENKKAAMTFVGYGISPFIDFCYIDPHSCGEKVVSFDVNSSRVIAHTLHGTGFLINTGEVNGFIKGYVIYYAYLGEGSSGTNAKPVAMYLYRIKDGVTASALHNNILFEEVTHYMTLVDTQLVFSWDTNMSIKIKVTPDEVQVWQQAWTGEEIDESTTPFFSHELDNTGCNGYGPLVAYKQHDCPRASSFTYSNLYMYFTDPEEEITDMMSPLAEADFTQKDTQKYFVNLFGGDDLEYGADDFRQYQGYLKIMQEEGIAMITDRDAHTNTHFDEYLGSANDPKKAPENLMELQGGGPGNKLSVDELVKQIDGYLGGRKSTSLKEAVEGGALTPADPKESVGNIWLQSADSGEQFRSLDWNSVEGDEYRIQINDISYRKEGSGDISVTYQIRKPGGAYTSLNIDENGTFQISRRMAKWPEGSYTVQQTITQDGKECGIKGYAYFNLEYPPQYIDPVTYPVSVTVKARLDGQDWPEEEHKKRFMLQPGGGGAMVDPDPSTQVPEGSYSVWEVTELAEDGTLREGVDTGVKVEVENQPTEGQSISAAVDYYTVTFYANEADITAGNPYGNDTPWKQQIVLNKGYVVRPDDYADPERPRYHFAGWKRRVENADGETFLFGSEDGEGTPITQKTQIYATWSRVTVSVNVQKDNVPWDEQDSDPRRKRDFKLLPEGGTELIALSDADSVGTYAVYDVTGLEDTVSPGVDRNTGASVVITPKDVAAGAEIVATVDYYTVSFYDENSADKQLCETDGEQNPQIVLKNQHAVCPVSEPTKDKRTFDRWVTKEGTAFPFDSQAITEPTEIYAKWLYPVTVRVPVKKDDSLWPGHGKRFMLLSENAGDDEERQLIGLSGVSEGKYSVWEVSGQAGDGSLREVDTGVTVDVAQRDKPGEEIDASAVDYYTVTFYDAYADGERYADNTDQAQQIVLKGQKARTPSAPARDKFSFHGWVTDDGTAEGKKFEIDLTEITAPVKLYAAWERVEEDRYKVAVNARRDAGEWQDSGRTFALRTEDGETVYDLEQVKNGTYRIYDITGGARARAAEVMDVRVEDGDTGVTVTVENADKAADVDYYTVTFYDGSRAYGADTLQSPMIVLNGKRALEPRSPGKKGHRFTGWKTGTGSGTAFDFDQPIRSRTDIYAGWRVVETKSGHDRKPEGGTEDAQTVTVLQQEASPSPQAETSQPDQEPSESGEPKTMDATHIEIYATVAMIAGLTYLLLYFMEEGRGMTEREKEVFVAAFIRWAKKGGRFRKCCAIVAIFCILVYYHSIGKRKGKEINREYLRQAL